MLRLIGCALLGLAVVTAGVQGQADKAGKDAKKDAKAGMEIVGKVKLVDLTKMSFTITTKDGKDRMFHVTAKTRFVGPKGGASTQGLKDDRMAKGNEVKVTPAADNKMAAEVKLPLRKKTK
jgi:hypothetical protein